MFQSKAWFDRVFAFDLPEWMYPVVIERLRGTPARLEDRLRELARGVLTRRDGEKWSIQENAGHLLDLEPLWNNRLSDFLAGAERLQVADLSNRTTHEARHNDSPLEGILSAFRSARADFVERLDELDPAAITSTALHPRLGTPMRLLDHIFFVAEHDDHHLARITSLLRQFHPS